METWLTGLLWVAVALALPVAALEPVVPAGARTTDLVLEACADGSAYLLMGCASVQL
jgi:hypothetical protein